MDKTYLLNKILEQTKAYCETPVSIKETERKQFGAEPKIIGLDYESQNIEQIINPIHKALINEGYKGKISAIPYKKIGITGSYTNDKDQKIIVIGQFTDIKVINKTTASIDFSKL